MLFTCISPCLARDHRDDGQQLIQLQLQHIPCQATFQLYEPAPEYRETCPWILVVCKGQHAHPAPIPQNTPPLVRLELDKLLQSLDTELADLTAR
jgi:hypothetical protein